MLGEAGDVLVSSEMVPDFTIAANAVLHWLLEEDGKAKDKRTKEDKRRQKDKRGRESLF
jgi:hypothetical protein